MNMGSMPHRVRAMVPLRAVPLQVRKVDDWDEDDDEFTRLGYWALKIDQVYLCWLRRGEIVRRSLIYRLYVSTLNLLLSLAMHLPLILLLAMTYHMLGIVIFVTTNP